MNFCNFCFFLEKRGYLFIRRCKWTRTVKMSVKMFGAEPKEKKVPVTERWNGNYPDQWRKSRSIFHFVISKYQHVRILSGNALTSETVKNPCNHEKIRFGKNYWNFIKIVNDFGVMIMLLVTVLWNFFKRFINVS